MSLLTTVIDDKSPLISYDATWLPGTSLDDNLAVDYYLGTFQKNNVADGTATFKFNGTAVWIYGANRPNHGIYTVQVDGTNQASFNGSGNNLFQQTLFSTAVSQGSHTVSLTNTGGSSGLYVDIDMIVWQSKVGSAGGELVPEVVEDWDPRFQYQQSVWSTASSSGNIIFNLFNNGTGHATDTSNAAVSLTFIGMLIPMLLRFKLMNPTGEAVTLFGTSGPSNGPYSVQLDGGQSVQYNATNAYPTSYGVTIYHADNLGPGTHQIVLTNLPDQSGQYFTIDYAQLWTIANSSNLSGSNITCPPPSNSNFVSPNELGSGAIAGLVVEGVVAIIAAAAALFFYLRWKAALANHNTRYPSRHQSSETTTRTATGMAPSLDAWSNPNSPQNNTSFQAMAGIGVSYQQSDASGVQNNPVAQVTSSPFDSVVVLEEANSSGMFLNGGRASARPLPIAPGEQVRQSNATGSADARWSVFADTSESNPPPGYDTAVRVANA